MSKESDAAKKSARKAKRAIASTIAAAIAGGIYLVVTLRTSALVPDTVLAMCPPDARSGRLQLITGAQRAGRRTTTVEAAFSVYDVSAGGARVARAPIQTKELPSCLGGSVTQVWVNAPGGDGLHLRRTDTGHVALTWVALLERNPVLQAGIRALGYDSRIASATAMLGDARTVSLAPTGAVSGWQGHPTMHALYGGFADGVLQTSAIPFHTSGNPRLVLRDKRRLGFEGAPRARVLIDGVTEIPGVDFYLPAFLPNPQDGTVEWPDGTVLVVEETAIGSMTYAVHRLTLSGKTVWTYRPTEALPASWKYRPIPWQPMADGSVLVHFGATGMVGISPETGQEVFRAAY
jgi:hypothetical protein